MSKTKQLPTDADKPRKKGSGGARPGAGRPKTTAYTQRIWVTPAEKEIIINLRNNAQVIKS